MAHPRRRDGSGLRRTPALVGLHHPPARRCRPLPSPNTASTLLSRPCRRPGDWYRVYPRLETSEPVKLSEFLELGFPPKENWRHVASDHKTSETQNAALRSLALASLPPLSNPTLPSLRTTAVPARRTAARHRYPAAAVARQDHRGGAAAG